MFQNLWLSHTGTKTNSKWKLYYQKTTSIILLIFNHLNRLLWYKQHISINAHFEKLLEQTTSSNTESKLNKLKTEIK